MNGFKDFPQEMEKWHEQARQVVERAYFHGLLDEGARERFMGYLEEARQSAQFVATVVAVISAMAVRLAVEEAEQNQTLFS